MKAKNKVIEATSRRNKNEVCLRKVYLVWVMRTLRLVVISLLVGKVVVCYHDYATIF